MHSCSSDRAAFNFQQFHTSGGFSLFPAEYSPFWFSKHNGSWEHMQHLMPDLMEGLVMHNADVAQNG